jgi:hypothetical protein
MSKASDADYAEIEPRFRSWCELMLSMMSSADIGYAILDSMALDMLSEEEFSLWRDDFWNPMSGSRSYVTYRAWCMALELDPKSDSVAEMFRRWRSEGV